MRAVSCALLCALLLHSALAFSFTPKRLNGPPAEFALHAIPDPSTAATYEESALLAVEFSAEKESAWQSRAAWQGDLLVDSTSRFIFALYSPFDEQLEVELRDPSGQKVELKKHEVDAEYPYRSFGAPLHAPGWEFEAPQQGVWKLSIVSKRAYPHKFLHKQLAQHSPESYVLVWNESKERILSFLQTYKLEKGSPIGVSSEIFEFDEEWEARYVDRLTKRMGSVSRDSIVPPVSSRAHVKEAQLNVTLPDGSNIEIDMKDDGLSGDALAGDGLYGAQLRAPEAGTYLASATLKGVFSDGTPFVRTTEHILAVVDDDIDFEATAERAVLAQQAEGDQISLRFPVTGGVVGRKYRVFSEVFGTDAATGKMIPVAWVGGMTELVEGTPSLELELNAKWLKMAGATEPLQLRNAYIADANDHVPLTEAAKLPVTHVDGLIEAIVQRTEHPESITEEMRSGRRPAYLKEMLERRNRALAAGEEVTPSLVLVHGYCAQIHPFEEVFDQFTDAYLFKDLGQNRRNTEFADLVMEATKDFGSFGLVGHSQGGPVSLHIQNYWWTGLDNGSSGRRVQSVGSPYSGNSGAGTGANIIKIFGFGCGANVDLSVDGTNLWKAGISMDAREKVYYYYSQYKKSGLIKYCNLAVNLVLQWPNDGTAEVNLTHLEGGNDQGLTAGECHSVNMKWPPQCWNKERSVTMSELASR